MTERVTDERAHELKDACTGYMRCLLSGEEDKLVQALLDAVEGLLDALADRTDAKAKIAELEQRISVLVDDVEFFKGMRTVLDLVADEKALLSKISAALES